MLNVTATWKTLPVSVLSDLCFFHDALGAKNIWILKNYRAFFSFIK